MFKLNKYPAKVIPYSTVAAQSVDLDRGVWVSKLLCTLAGSIQIAAGGGASGVLLIEALVKLMRWVRITEAGTPTIEWDPRALLQMVNRENEHRVSPIFIVNGDVQGPTPFRLDFELSFASRLFSNPYETVYRPVDPDKPFQLEVEWEPNVATALFSAAFNRVITFPTAPSLTVLQVEDRQSQMPPIYLPRLRRVNSTNINGVTQDFEMDLKMATGNVRSRGLLIHTLGDGNTNGGIITGNFSLEGLKTYLKRVDPGQLHAEERFLHPAVDNAPGYYFLNFVENGRLTNAYQASQDGALKLKADVGLGGAAVGIIRVYDMQLIRYPGITRELKPGDPLA